MLLPCVAFSQALDLAALDPTAAGPWSEKARTTLMVPKVANDSVKADGTLGLNEYGGFTGVTVTPGVSAWILNWPEDRAWDNAQDSNFTFWLAHDDNYLYVGIKAQDDVVNSDDPNGSFWKDDAIEIVTDALTDGFDNNTDNSKDPVGGHSYLNFQGRLSAWDENAGAKGSQSWANEVDWKYGASGDVFGKGAAVTGGWQMEARFHKRMFESPTAGNKLRNGYRMGFNIGLDDDDKKGPGANGDKSRSQDLEIQYFWANRQRYKGVDADYLGTLSAEDKAAQVWRTDAENHPFIIDGNGRLSHAGTGEIIFGYDENQKSSGKILFMTSSSASPINSDPALIALLQAKGYIVTVFQSGGPPDEMRNAIVGQDVVFISETIGSGSVLEPIGEPAVQKFILRDSNIPVISAEAYMWDNAEWTEHPADFSNEFSFFGNTGRTENDQPASLKDAVDSLYIRNAAHPMAKGLPAKAKVYNTPYSFNYGKPSADADVIASTLADGTYPTLFVYEKGDKLVDGSTVPNKRIGLFFGQAASLVANWAPELGFLTEDGKTLLLNTIDYAIGKPTTPPKIAIDRSNTGLTITYSGGTLQSADSLNGTYSNETGASPLTVSSFTGSTRFYRVKSN